MFRVILRRRREATASKDGNKLWLTVAVQSVWLEGVGNV
jgi:hypothetical protein